MRYNIRSGNDVSVICKDMQTAWRGRETAMKRWYNLIRLKNDLAQTDMESVIAADPRTGFNMASWLLTPKTPTYLVALDDLTEEEASVVGPVENYCNREYMRLNQRTRAGMYGTAIKRMVNLGLATGWFSVISFPTPQGWAFGIWNPATVFPEYDEEGNLIAVARIYSIPSNTARLKIASEGWLQQESAWPGRTSTVCSLWWLDDVSGVTLAHHAVSIDRLLTKPPQPEPFTSLPITVAPVGGLPDDGSITQDNDWRSEVGQSVVAPIMDVQKNYDKMLTYFQQIIRDTANPRWIEQVRGDPVAKSEDLFKRGMLWTYEPGEGLGPVQMPSLPAELRSHLFELRAQVQRGMFSDISFGNITSQVSVFLMSQVTAAAQQVLSPFMEGLQAIMGKIATFNVAHMRALGASMPNNQPWPKLPQDLTINFDYDVEIPGDFLQRATAMRQLNPEAKLSQTTLIDILFPEVKNAVAEQGRIIAEDSARNPVVLAVRMIREINDSADEAERNEDMQFAQMLRKAALVLEQQTFGPAPTNGQGGEQNGLTTTVPESIRQLTAGGV